VKALEILERKKLHFTADFRIDSEHSVLFNRMAFDIRKSFTDTIESISKQHSKCIDWWVSSPASRNTFASPLFHYCCCFALLEELIRLNEPIHEIITDSRAFKRILKDYLASRGINARVISARLSLKQRLRKLLLPIYAIFGLPSRHLLQYFATRYSRSLRKTLPSEPLTLIDTFIMSGFIKNDRYYPGMIDSLSEHEKQHVWFVPHLYGFHSWQLFRVIKILRETDKNIILKDDYLKYKDYWCVWGYLLRVRKLHIKAYPFCGTDISGLVREELMGFRSICSSQLPFLNYLFAKRLKEAGVKLRLVVDWFENQSIDKAWNAGFRHFYPDVETIGYQGFVATKHFLCLYPTEEERKSKVIPHKIFVIGRKMVQSTREFCPSLDVKGAPAFRFQHVWFKRKYLPEPNIFTILVALPNMTNEAVHILKMIAGGSTKSAGVRLWIKRHPGTSTDKIKSAYGPTWPEQFEFVDGEFSECIEKSNLLISAASSTSMETLAKGIPAIIVGNRNGLTHNLIPESITDDIWRLCYSSQELVEAVQLYQDRSLEKICEHKMIGRKIREDYFEPLTPEGIREFLRIGCFEYQTNRNA